MQPQTLDRQSFYEFLANLSQEEVIALYRHVKCEITKCDEFERADILRKREWIREYLRSQQALPNRESRA